MEELSKILLAIIAAGILIALANGGWTGPGGVKDWWKAKFLGQP